MSITKAPSAAPASKELAGAGSASTGASGPTAGTSTACLALLTSRSKAMTFRDGGSRAWTLNHKRASSVPYAVLCRNEHGAHRPSRKEAPEAHRSAFMVARIRDLVPDYERPEDRWLVQFDAYAEVDVPDAWQGWRCPTIYTTLEELGIDIAKLDFKPMPRAEDLPSAPFAGAHGHREGSATAGGPGYEATDATGEQRPLSIAEAKHGLAAFYGVPPENIEIVIRG